MFEWIKTRLRHHPGWPGAGYRWLFRVYYGLSYRLATFSFQQLTWRSLQQRYQDGAFDRLHGTRTSGVIELNRLQIDSANLNFGIRYQATSTPVFQRILTSLDGLAMDYPQTVCVDLGCGKGRVLLLATDRPFQRIVGVEFAPQLAAAAEANIRAFTRNRATTVPVTVVCGDVTHYRPPLDANLLIYCYNPFQASVMVQVVRNLENWMAQSGRSLHFVYTNPVRRVVLDLAGFLIPVVVDPDYVIYRGIWVSEKP